MNPSCQTDINSPECQKWMNEVCVRCKELFAQQANDKWAAWWHDPTPAMYKDVPEMTVHDCNKLRHLLEQQVSAIKGPQPLKFTQFTWWQKTMLIATYIVIMVLLAVICCFWKRDGNGQAQKIDEDVSEEQATHSPQSHQSSSPPEDAEKHDKHKHNNFRTWMRHRCRPFFIHNEATLRRQHAKYKEQEKFKDAYTQKNIERWTKAREDVENKRKKKIERKQAEQKRKDTKRTDPAQMKVEFQDAV